MHLQASGIVAGLAVGLVVGMTGSGGGALLTPILILFLGVNAKTAVASDLVATLTMRPVAGAVHLGRHYVRWPIVGWLAAGSVPAAFLAGYVSPRLISATESSKVLSPAIGAALLISGGFAVLRRVLRRRSGVAAPRAVEIRPLWTLLIGLVGGLVVGVTSVGSGTLMLVALGVVYPGLAPSELVGTDLVQAVPLVGAAALGHLLDGGLHVSLTTSLIVGGVPAALIGALVGQRLPHRHLGTIVAVVIFGSGCALIGWVPGSIVGGVALVVFGLLARRLRRVQAVAPPVRLDA